MRSPGSRAKAVFAFFLLSFAGAAHAHSTVKGVGDLYAGLLHVLTALEHVLPFIALSLLAGQRGLKAQAEAVLLVFPVALMAGAAAAMFMPPLPGLAFFNIASAILLGGLVAAALPLPRMLFYGLFIAFGISTDSPTAKPYRKALKLTCSSWVSASPDWQCWHTARSWSIFCLSARWAGFKSPCASRAAGLRRSLFSCWRRVAERSSPHRHRTALFVERLHCAGHALQGLLQQRPRAREI